MQNVIFYLLASRRPLYNQHASRGGGEKERAILSEKTAQFVRTESVFLVQVLLTLGGIKVGDLTGCYVLQHM